MGPAFEHVDLGGASEHGEREEETGAQGEGDADGAEIVGHENGTEGEAHKRRVHVEHHICGGDLHLVNTRAEIDGKRDFDDGRGEDADETCGLDERQAMRRSFG